jgi:hypothetical protein
MRRHGYNVPEPDAHNHVNTRGLPVKTSKYSAAVTECYENPNKTRPSK